MSGVLLLVPVTLDVCTTYNTLLLMGAFAVMKDMKDTYGT